MAIYLAASFVFKVFNKNMLNNKIFILVFVTAVFILGALMYIYNPVPAEYKNPNEKEPTACTMEARLCPDGSYVGRTGPNCEFTPCPIPPGTMFEDGVVNPTSTTQQ